MSLIYGRNPVLEALSNPDTIQKIYVQHGLQHPKIRQIYKLAKQHSIAISNADVGKLRQMVGDTNHQGVVALIAPVKIRDFWSLDLDKAKQTGQLCLVIADRIQDPHNMGAIIRSAEIFGARGVVFSTRENVPITDVVVKASAGAALHCPLYRADNLVKAAQWLKENGVWIYGAALETKVSLWQVDFNRHCAVVIGNEEKGIRPLLQKHCDQLFRIPQIGKTQSLNASVAAGVTLAEMLRQRLSNPQK
jgi:23S rRNA (guanosine2251-2'-O)-methyltransferase